MSSTLPTSKIAWIDSWLNIMFSFARSSPIQIFVRNNVDSFIRFCIRLCDFFFHSFALQECIRADFFVAEMSIHIHVRSGMPLLPLWARSASVKRSVTSCAPAWTSLFVPCFQRLGYVCVRSGMLLLLALPTLFQRYLGCRSWSFKPFENYSISVLRGHTTKTISRYRSVGHDCE